MQDDSPQIVFIEDKSEDILLIEEGFRQLDINPNTKFFQKGRDALEFLATTPETPKLIVLDLNLPELDGREVLVQLRKMKKLMSVPIVVFSTSNSKSDIEFCYAKCANSYIVKPVGFSGLLDVLSLLFNYWVLLNEN